MLVLRSELFLPVIFMTVIVFFIYLGKLWIMFLSVVLTLVIFSSG